jgi:hypothetical protein
LEETNVVATPSLNVEIALQIRELQVQELALKNKIQEMQIQHSGVLAKLSMVFQENSKQYEGFTLNPATLKFEAKVSK